MTNEDNRPILTLEVPQLSRLILEPADLLTLVEARISNKRRVKLLV